MLVAIFIVEAMKNIKEFIGRAEEGVILRN